MYNNLMNNKKETNTDGSSQDLRIAQYILPYKITCLFTSISASPSCKEEKQNKLKLVWKGEGRKQTPSMDDEEACVVTM